MTYEQTIMEHEIIGFEKGYAQGFVQGFVQEYAQGFAKKSGAGQGYNGNEYAEREYFS